MFSLTLNGTRRHIRDTSPNTTLPLHMSDFSGGSTNMKLSDRVLLLLLFLAMLLILFKK